MADIDLSFIVCAYNQPTQLLTCITSLMVQTCNKEIIICDNSTSEDIIKLIQQYSLLDKSISYINTRCPPGINAGYAAHNIGAKKAKGQYLCFPSGDSYYVPGFSETMLGAAREYKWDFVYCDMLYDPRYNGINTLGCYSVMPGVPRFRFIDSTNFILKKEYFAGWSLEDPNGFADYLLCEELLRTGISHGHAPGVMVVHN